MKDLTDKIMLFRFETVDNKKNYFNVLNIMTYSFHYNDDDNVNVEIRFNNGHTGFYIVDSSEYLRFVKFFSEYTIYV